MKNPEVGDLAISVAGHDKGRVFLVVAIEGRFAFITDGKTRKTVKPKKKNVKHLITVKVAADKQTAMKIQSGGAVGNDRIKKLIAATK